MRYAIIPRRVSTPTQLPRHVLARIEAVHHDALVDVARIHDRAYVTHHLLQTTALLSGEEAGCLTVQPLGEARYRQIVDTFTVAGCADISGVVWR